MTWRKSSYSNPSGNCVFVYRGWPVVQVRDTKDPGPVLKFTPAQWAAFLAQVKEDCPDCEGRGRVQRYAQSRWEPCALCGRGRMTG